MRTAVPLFVLLVTQAFVTQACGAHAAPPFVPAAAAAAAPIAAAGADPVILAAGDIAVCATTNDERTADLLDTLPGEVITLGDLAYENGTATEFANCYDPTWGRHKARTHPSPGNHEYNTPGATGYYDYFGTAAGDPTKGYYSFDVGAWHLIALNSNCSAIGGCGASSPQVQWLRADLRDHPAACTLAYWHHPRFSSGPHGSSTALQPIVQALYDYGADIALAGHDHHYERFAPQTAAAAADATWGVRAWVVGTGGRSLYAVGAPRPNSEVRNSASYGVLQLTLHANSYDFEFKPAAGSTFTDSGSGTCHGAQLDPDADGWLDSEDNCPAAPNPTQANADGDLISNAGLFASDDRTWLNSDTSGDACDTDDDNDGLTDADEASGAHCAGIPSLPTARDTDGDRVHDGAECARGTDPANPASAPALTACGPATDADGDSIADRIETCVFGSDSTDPNSDADGCGDGRELASLNADANVNVADLGMLVAETQRVPPPPRLAHFDLTGDGSLNIADRAFLASRSGACP